MFAKLGTNVTPVKAIRQRTCRSVLTLERYPSLGKCVREPEAGNRLIAAARKSGQVWCTVWRHSRTSRCGCRALSAGESPHISSNVKYTAKRGTLKFLWTRIVEPRAVETQELRVQPVHTWHRVRQYSVVLQVKKRNTTVFFKVLLHSIKQHINTAKIFIYTFQFENGTNH